MGNLVERMKKNLPAGCIRKRKRYSKEGCSVSLQDAPTPCIMIDIDKAQALVKGHETKCDFIFIGGSNNVLLAPLELTKKELKASKVVKQLQAGANLADAHIIPAGEQVKFQPVAYCGGKIHRAEKRRLLQSKIRFKNQSSNVQLLKCGQPLIEALSEEN